MIAWHRKDGARAHTLRHARTQILTARRLGSSAACGECQGVVGQVDRPVDPSGHSGLSHDVGTADRFAQRFRRCRRIASKSRRAVRRRHRWRWLEGGGGDWPINAWPVCNAPGVATWTKRNGRRIGLERAARAHGLLPPLSQSLLRHRRQWCGATGALGPTTAHAWKARGMGVRAAEVGWVG